MMDLNAPASGVSIAVEGYKIADFRFHTGFASLRDALDARERHRELVDLVQSMQDHWEIPMTFDGEIPEFAFGSGENRLLVGQRYEVNVDGNTTVATLEQGTVSIPERRSYCVMRTEDGRQILVSAELSDEELVAYQRHPETFFGVMHQPMQRAQSAFELYDFFFRAYGNAPRERLLEFMQGNSHYDEFFSMDQQALARRYCEGLTLGALRNRSA